VIVTGEDRAPETQQCSQCGYIGRTVLVVRTLEETPDSPAEYAWACPECMGVETLDPWEGEDGEDDDEYYADQTGMSKDERAWA